jgi:hypothetical protein
MVAVRRTGRGPHLLHTYIQGLHYSEIWSNIGRATLGRKFDVAIWRAACEARSAMRNLGTNSDLIWGRGKPRKTVSDLAGCRTFRMQTTYSQQSGIKHANPNIRPLCAVALFERKFTYLFLYIFLFTCMPSVSQYSSVGIATGDGLDDRGVGVRVRGSKIFTPPCRPDRLWGSFSGISNGYRGLFPRG